MRSSSPLHFGVNSLQKAPHFLHWLDGNRLYEISDEGVLRSDGLDAHAVGVPKGPAPGATPRPLDLEGAQAIALFYDQINFRPGAGTPE